MGLCFSYQQAMGTGQEADLPGGHHLPGMPWEEKEKLFAWPQVDTAATAFPCTSEGSSSPNPPVLLPPQIPQFCLPLCPGHERNPSVPAFQSQPSQNLPAPFHISQRIPFESSPGKGREAEQWGEPGLFSLLVCCSSRLCGELPKPLSLWHSIKLSSSRAGAIWAQRGKAWEQLREGREKLSGLKTKKKKRKEL